MTSEANIAVCIIFLHFCSDFVRKSSSDLVGLNLFQSPTNSNSDSSTPTIGAAGQSYSGSVVSPTGTGSPSNRQNTATPGKSIVDDNKNRNDRIRFMLTCSFLFFYAAGEDLFDEVGEIVPALPPKQGRLPAPGSRGSTPTLSTIAVPRPPSRKGIEVCDAMEIKKKT